MSVLEIADHSQTWATAGFDAAWAAGGGTHPFFPDATWLYDPIVSSPVLDTNSAALVTALTATGVNRVLGTQAFGVSIYTADTSWPKWTVGDSAHPFTVSLAGTASGDFGGCDLTSYSVPFPSAQADMVIASGTDKHVCIIDPVQGKVFSLWATTPTYSAGVCTGLVCDFGGVYTLSSDGLSYKSSYNASFAPYNATYPNPISTSTACGICVCAGTILTSELTAGLIPHALTFGSDITNNLQRYPGTTTDGGAASGPSSITEGTRIQLDPTINVSAIAGITPYELMMAKALQTYGAYCVDKGGARMSFYCELALSTADTNAQAAVGLTADYEPLSHIPFSSLRVLNSWDGS